MTDKPKSMRNAGATASISRESILMRRVAELEKMSHKLLKEVLKELAE